MKRLEYEKILQSIEHAIAVCDQSAGLMDHVHEEICRELRATRRRLLQLIGSGGTSME